MLTTGITDAQQANPSLLNLSQGPNAVRPGDYDTPVPQAVTAFNQYMMQAAEYFDPFIQKALLSTPRFWYNMIPRGAKENFSGLVHETRIFRGGLGHYAGLAMFDEIDPVPTSTHNPCVRGAIETGTYAWERLDWKGYSAFWGSDPICVDQWKYTPQAVEQLAWILQYGAERGIDIQEVWNRDWLIRTATVDADGGAGRGYVMTKTFVGNTTPEKFYYDPLVKFGTGSGQVDPATGITKPFIVFKAGVEVETLNFDVLGALKDELDVSCPDAAIGSDAGTPLFGLPVAKKDFEKFVMGSDYEVKNWRESRSEKLITGITGVKTHRDWALPWDGNQLRFKIKKVVSNYDASSYGNVAVGTLAEGGLEGEVVIIAEFVAPRVAGRTGENGIAIPEYNPEYGTAELAVAPIQLNKVFTNLFGSDLTTLGSGTYFGPQPGLNGKWSWINIRDRVTNPHGKIGNFEGEFQIFPKPEPRVVFSTAMLYRRCTESIRARCPIDNSEVNPDSATGTSSDAVVYACADSDAGADTFTVTATLEKTLSDLPVGATAVLSFSGTGSTLELTAYAVKTSTAPVYEFHVTGNGVIDLVAIGSAAATKYHIGANGHLYYTPDEGAALELTLDTVTVG